MGSATGYSSLSSCGSACGVVGVSALSRESISSCISGDARSTASMKACKFSNNDLRSYS